MLVNEKCTALKEVCDIFDLTNMVVDPTCFTKGASPSLNDVILTKQTKLLHVRIPTIITVVLVMYITLYQYK